MPPTQGSQKAEIGKGSSGRHQDSFASFGPPQASKSTEVRSKTQICRPSGAANRRAKNIGRPYVRTAPVPYLSQSTIPARRPSSRTSATTAALAVVLPANVDGSQDAAIT